MAKIDEIYKDLVNTIIDEGQRAPGYPRAHYADGEPAYTREIFGVNFKIKPEDGLPILQSKRVAMKSFKAEIDWIWRLMSNDIDELNELGSKVWNEWTKSKRVYNLIFTESKDYLNDKIFHNGKGITNSHYQDLLEDPVFMTKDSKNYGKFNVLEKNWKENKYKIQFIDTGFINYVTQSQVSVGDVKDYYYRSVDDLGYYGNYRKKELIDFFGQHFSRWVNTWENMIRRCSKKYENQWLEYDDVYVSPEFQCCELFLEWVMLNAPKEKDMLSILQIDKDYYNSKIYSPETCVLLTPKENTALTLNKWFFYENILFTSEIDIAQFIHKITNGKMGLTPKGRVSTTAKSFIEDKKDSGELIEINPQIVVDGKIPRFSLDWKNTILEAYGAVLRKTSPRIINDSKGDFFEQNIDQVSYIINQIKYNPGSRRIMTNLYEVPQLHNMALEPCVFMTSWHVRENNQLDLIVTQRSADVALGLPSNLFEYSLLHHRIAQVTGREVGTLHWNIFNAHIYDRHIDLLQEQVNADISHLEDTHAKFILPEDKDYFNVSLRDVEVVDYVHNGSYKYEIAI